MIAVRKLEHNPVLAPDEGHPWEAEATFNPSAVRKDGVIHLVYRAVSKRRKQFDAELEVSSIGYAESRAGTRFKNRRELIAPEEEWEKYGCEDPRVTEFEGKYFIFYTALSRFPFSADGIRVGVGVTKDFKTVEKHPVTPFNAKAMVLFPERINGKVAAILTVHTDRPPAKICLAFFDKVEDIWSPRYWDEWYRALDTHVLSIERDDRDHMELGTPPLKTKEGWLVFYSYIYNYFSPPPTFGIQAVLLGLENPAKIVGEVKRPFIVPDEEYERYGRVPNVVFPSGALLREETVSLYYGAADTTSCVATIPLKDLLEQLVFVKRRELNRFEGNPIIQPIQEHEWESKATFNPAALLAEGRVHLLYRAMSGNNTSVLGYASSPDGVHFDRRLPAPVYVPRQEFEMKLQPGNSGVEDPRLTRIDDMVYMCYTAFDGKNPPRVAFTSIGIADFVSGRWNWATPILISPPNADDKDAALFPRKINGKYVFLHRLGTDIWIDAVDDLSFKKGRYLNGKVLMSPRETAWDSRRIGIAGPPLETKVGWLLLYHGITKGTSDYNVRAALLDLNDPTKVLYRIHDPILEPEMAYEKKGIVPNVVFPCGAVVRRGELFVYYGCADRVTGVATVRLENLMDSLLHEARYHKG